MLGFSYSSKTSTFQVNFDVIFEFLQFKKHTPVSSRPEVAWTQIYHRKSSISNAIWGTPICHLLKVPEILKCLEWEAVFRVFISLWYHWWKFQKAPWDKGEMFKKFCMIWHGTSPLKTWILQIQTITEKTKLIVYLILDEIKSFNLKNEHLEKKSPKSEKKKQFYTS